MIPKRVKVDLFPNTTLQRLPIEHKEVFESFDNDPYFHLMPENRIIKAGWYILNYNINITQGEILLPKVYFDFGDGFSEKYHWRLFYHNGVIFGLVKVPWDCFRLRLDISESNITFEHGEVKLTKVSKAQAALQFFSLLDAIGESRLKFLKDLMAQKSFKGQKKLLKSLFEGNYVPLEYQKVPDTEKVKAPAEPAENLAEILNHSSLDRAKFQQFIKVSEKLAKAGNKVNIRLNAPVDIILPVYNGIEYLEKLLPQLVANSDLPFVLHIIDDCSPDKKIATYLEWFEKNHENIKVKRNEVNLGFTKTVNRLLKACTSDVVVLLNSDIEVPSNWLSRLIAPFFLDDKIATITPISNCATICSFPNVGDNPLLQGSDVEEINAPLRNMGLYYEEIPTGVGFCMAINRKMTQKVGILNEEAFPRGYGEEVDLCFRARKKGFKNVLNTSLFVYHKHGGSFTSAEKVKLLNANQQKLEAFHPEFHTVLQRYFKENTFILFKIIYLLKLIRKEGKKITLFLDHDLGGGTNVYSKNYFSDNKDQVFLYGQYLNPNRNEHNQILFTVDYQNYKFKFALDDLQVLFDLLNRYDLKLDEVVINHLVSYKDSIKVSKQVIAYKKAQQVRLKVLCHDFYFICPNFLLFRENVESCGVPTDLNVCNKCISNLSQIIDPKLVPNDFVSLPEWRKNWGDLLVNEADELLVFSESTRKLFMKVWPQLEAKVTVKPHTLKGFTKFNSNVYRIGILGSIHSVAKGGKFIQELANYLQENNLRNFKLINFGGIHPSFDHDLIDKKGPYKLDELHFSLKKNRIDVVLIPSVWEETFSFTTREAIESGIPTACFPLGGQYDQVKHYDKGIVVKEIKPEAVVEAISSYFEGVKA
jgi:GT2 family glycosyltransferase